MAITYINRLSDLLWLFGRLVEKDAGVDGTVTIAEAHAEYTTRGLRLRGLATVAEVEKIMSGGGARVVR